MTNNMSFYGGRPGKSFVITKVFNTYEELQLDADKGWSSTIPIGDYVIIGYKYDEDINLIQEKIYGGTLWQKVYNDKALNNNSDIYDETTKTIEINGRTHYFAHGEKAGVGYKFISETGNTPQLFLEHEILAPNMQPELETIFRNHGGAKYNFKLPRSANYYYFDCIYQGDNVIELINSYNNFNDEIIINNLIKFYLNDSIVAENLTYDNNIGDYFIEKNIGLVYKLEGEEDSLKLKFKTCLTVLPEAVTNISDYAILNNNNEFELNTPNIEAAINQNISSGQLNSLYTFSLPKSPTLKFDINFEASPNTYITDKKHKDGINYTINFPAGLKGISNFNIKYIVDTFTNLPSKENTTELEFADLALVGQNGSFTLYIYTNNEWQQLSQLNEINFVTGNSLGEIKQSVVTDGAKNNELNYYNIKVMNDMLSWNGNVEQPKFLSVKEGTEAPNSNISGQLYINTNSKELYYEGNPIRQKTQNVLEFGENLYKPINSQAVKHLEGGQFKFNIPNNLEWKKETEELYTYQLTFNNQDVYRWLEDSYNRTPLITFVEDYNEKINLDRQQQFDKIYYIDLSRDENTVGKIIIKIGVQTKTQQFPATIENVGLPILCIIPGGEGVTA